MLTAIELGKAAGLSRILTDSGAVDNLVWQKCRLQQDTGCGQEAAHDLNELYRQKQNKLAQGGSTERPRATPQIERRGASQAQRHQTSNARSQFATVEETRSSSAGSRRTHQIEKEEEAPPKIEGEREANQTCESSQSNETLILPEFGTASGPFCVSQCRWAGWPGQRLCYAPFYKRNRVAPGRRRLRPGHQN